MIQFDTYTLVTLPSSLVIFIIGVCLLVVSVPRETELKNYLIARRFLAGAYFVLAAVGQWEISGGIDSDLGSLVQEFKVIAASF